jgi:hypothetical protein
VSSSHWNEQQDDSPGSESKVKNAHGVLFQFTHPFNDFIAIFRSIEEVLDFIIIIL